MDTTQLFLTVILILTTVFLVMVGVQLFFALREFRKTLLRINTILDTAENASHELELSITGVASVFDGFRSLLKTLEVINLIAPLHDYLKRRHPKKEEEKSNINLKSSTTIHALMDKMKEATQKEKSSFSQKTR